MRQLPEFEGIPLTCIFRWLGWVGVLIIGVLSLLPGAARPHTGAPSQLEHYAAYLLVGFFLALGYPRRRNILAIAFFLALYAGLLECAQLYIPGRTARLIDALVGSIGAWTGIIFALAFSRLNSTRRLPQLTPLPKRSHP